jgi:hypothetical protein
MKNNCQSHFLYTDSSPPPCTYSDIVGWVAQSVQRLAMGWTVQESNPGGGEIFRTCPDWLWPNQPPVQWVPGLCRGVMLTRHSLLLPLVMQE